MRSFSIKDALTTLLAVAFVSAPSFSSAQNSVPSGVQGKTEALWLGQAGFRIKSPQGK